MDTETRTNGPETTWAPYVPDAKVPWDLRRVVHLHRRAGFAAAWGELQRDLADGPKASIDRLLAGKARGDGVPEDFERTADSLAGAALASADPVRLKAWWVCRMLFGPDPLTERLTLMWHNHFATSTLKVADLAAMRRQNELFRRCARAPFGKLVAGAIRDPALLVWLDAHTNRKGHPNENLGRELMELFTLGIGHYTEQDVKEAARTLTGWSVVDGEFREVPAEHDPGEKTVLGRRDRWRADDLVRILLDHPATAGRLAARLCELFFAPGVVKVEEVRALASGLRERELDVGWGVETVLRSRGFFVEENLGNRVLSPVEYVVGAVRVLEMFESGPSTLVLADWCARLGQDLFYPPNVFGWPGGRAWITTRSVIGRANFAAALVAGDPAGRASAFDAGALITRYARGGGLDDALTFFGELLKGSPMPPAWRERVLSALGPDASARRSATGRLVAAILASPEAQLA